VIRSGLIRRDWRYLRGNHNLHIKEEQTTEWPKEKVQKGQTTIYKTTIVYHVTINVRETEGAIRNGQYSETGNIGYTRHLHTQDTRQRQTNWQHWVYKTPPYTRHRQTNWQHWVYKTPPYTRQRQTKKKQKTKHNMG
jgi:hypothetical protein